ncbi:MAG: gamma-butyrobetaine hydroxylase-like domain-containing protein [Planctomycetota bacterium]|jgi:DUF971 family protein
MSDESPTDARQHWTEAERIIPTDLKLKLAEQQLLVQWQDGKRSVYDAVTLRRKCPCATCRTDRDKRSHSTLPMLNVLPNVDIRLTGAELIGQYAIKLTWSDGHDTGIFDYRYLHAS